MIENPFSGMNPYLEQRWGDVHTGLVTYGRAMIQDSLPPELRARMQERVFIEMDLKERAYYPDVLDYERPGETSRRPPSAGTAAVVAEPLLIRLPGVEITENFIEIIDAQSGGRVVTIVEFISRSNKAAGKGRKRYLQKRTDAIDAGVNFVEIDLLRGGKPVTLANPHLITEDQQAPYHACAWRAVKPDILEYYAFPLRSPLPSIRIPLRENDADVPLNLQELINLCYRRGRYDDIDYSRSLDPTLPPADADWVESIIRIASK